MRPSRHVRRAGTRPRYTRSSSYGRVPVRPNRRSNSQPGIGLPSLSLPTLRLPVIRIGWLVWLLVGLVAIGLLVVVANLTKVESIKVEGTKNLNTLHVQQLTEEGIKQQWFGRNILLVQTGGLASYLQDKEPAIKSATVHRVNNHTLNVSITERQPTLNWRSGNSLYLLDSDGTVIGPSQGAYESLPTITDGSSLPVEEGKRVVPASFVGFAAQLAAQLPASGVGVVAMTVPETTSELMVKTDKGYTIKFDTTRPVAGEITDLQVVLKELERSKKVPKEYIDLRIKNKAYYK